MELTREELRRRGVQEQNIISMNFESLRYEAFKDFRVLYQEVCKRADCAQGKVYILLDEIQEVDSWEQVINSLRVDLDCDIYVTGSNAKLLSGELATLLAGRYVEIVYIPWISGNIWILPRRIQRKPPCPSRSSLPISCGLEVFLGFIR